MRFVPTILALVPAAALGFGGDLEAQTENRQIEGVAIVPGASGFEAHVVWSIVVDKNAQPLDMSTDVVVRAGSVEVRETVKVSIGAGSLGCVDSSCGVGGCGQGAVNGQAMTLLCLPDGGGCACKVPPITTRLPLPPGFVGVVLAQLQAAPGSLPEADASDDTRQVAFDGLPNFWDRNILSVEKKPAASGVAGEFDLLVTYEIADRTDGQSYDISSLFVVTVSGPSTNGFAFEPCGPWILAPLGTCGSSCVQLSCATIVCQGQDNIALTCRVYENDYGQFPCVCASAPQQIVIPSVALTPSDVVTVSLQAAPGALPELQGIDVDTAILCGQDAQSIPYGVGKAGTNGVPVLSSAGEPVIGANSGIALGNGLPGALPILVLGFGDESIPFDGGTLLVKPAIVVTLPVPIAQDGTFTLQGPVPADASLCGVAVFHQILFQDPGAKGFYGLAMTNGLRRVFGS